MNLQDTYRAYNEKDIYPFHMPGHKRNTELCHMDNPYSIDYTEIDDLDDLHEASAHPQRDSMIANAMRRASKLFGSKTSFYLINGSSGGLVSSIIALTKRGDRVLIPRNTHKSIYNALALAGVRPVYVYPSLDEATGVSAAVRPKDVERAFGRYPDIKLALVVSPTFDGVVSNIESIAKIVHDNGAVLVVDEAHGPHLGLSPYFPDSAVHTGADVVVQSLHKTLPVLTQTSIIHICTDRVDPESISRTLTIIESTSPSYILMCSADQCVDLLEQRGEELFKTYSDRLDAFSEAMKGLKHLKVLCKGNDSMANHPNFYAFDKGKILVSTRGTNITGLQLYKRLLKEYRCQMEMCLADVVLGMTSIADTQEGFDRLQNALLEIDATLEDTPPVKPFPIKSQMISYPALTPAEAMARLGEFVAPEDAIGRTAREFVYAYPPGIPYIVPGEMIEADTLETMRRLEATGIRLIGTRHRFPEQIEVCQRKNR